MLNIHILISYQAIQDEKDLLLNIMNVFVKDPLLDWKKQAMVESKSQST